MAGPGGGGGGGSTINLQNQIKMYAEDFLNDSVAPQPGEIYFYWSGIASVSDPYVLPRGIITDPLGKVVTKTSGILYVKIHRLDINGKNNTLSLQELEQFRVLWTNVPYPLQYNVLSISEYPDYYLYLIDPKNTGYVYLSGGGSVIAGSDNDNIRVYANIKMSRSGSGVISSPSAAEGVPSYVPSFDSSSIPFPTMATGSLVASLPSGTLTFGDTPNYGLEVLVTSSITVYGNSGNTRVFVSMFDSNNNLVGSASSSLFTISASNQVVQTAIYLGQAPLNTITSWYQPYPIQGYKLKLGFLATGTDPDYAGSYQSASIAVRNRNNVTSSSEISSSFIISPYLSNVFRNSSCDVTMNNAIENRVSSVYNQIDYSTSTTSPVNIKSLISGTANFAQVNDYNFYSTPRVLSKYSGAKLKSQKLNVFTSKKIYGSALSIPEDTGPDKTPNFQLLDSYFIYFDWAGSTDKEYLGKSYIHIKALVDLDGNIYEPADVDANGDGIYWNSFVRTFFENNKSRILFRAGANSYPTPGLYNIEKVGTYPEVIIASQIEGNTQTEESGSVLSTLAFSNKTSIDRESLISYYDTTFVPSYYSKYTASDYQPLGLMVTGGFQYTVASTINYETDPPSYDYDYAYDGRKFLYNPHIIYVSGSEYKNNTSLSGSNGQYITIDNKYKYSDINLTLNFSPIFYNTEKHLNNTAFTSTTLNTNGAWKTAINSINNITFYLNCWRVDNTGGNKTRIPTPFDSIQQNEYLTFSPSLQQWIPSSSIYSDDIGGYTSASYNNKSITTSNFKVENVTDKYYFELKFRSVQFLKKNNAGIIEFTNELLFPSNWNTKDSDIRTYCTNQLSTNISASYSGNLQPWYQVFLVSLGLNLFNVNILVGQTPPGTLQGSRPTASYDPGSSLFYFTTGSNSKNILTGSQFTSAIYKTDSNTALYQALNPSGSTGTIYYKDNSDYPNFKQFQLFYGDEIRFECDENQIFKIEEVYPPGTTIYGTPTDVLVIKLDRDIPDGTNIDSFMIRRFKKLVNSLIIEGDALQGYNPAASSTADGFVIPEFLSPRVDYNSTIQKLYEQGIIPIQ